MKQDAGNLSTAVLSLPSIMEEQCPKQYLKKAAGSTAGMQVESRGFA